MASFQISCVGGQCDDPACGIDFVIVGEMRVPAVDLIDQLEQTQHCFWTVAQGIPVPIVVQVGEDGTKRLVADLSDVG